MHFKRHLQPQAAITFALQILESESTMQQEDDLRALAKVMDFMARQIPYGRQNIPVFCERGHRKRR